MYTVQSHAKSAPWPHEEICRVPLRSLIVAPSGSGKSVIISSMLGFEPYKKIFGKNVFFFSPTLGDDPEYAHLKTKEENIFDSYDPEVLLELCPTARFSE